MKIDFVNNIQDFNNRLNGDTEQLVCYLSPDYEINEQYIVDIIKIFANFDLVTAVYTDADCLLNRPFSPNKTLSSIKIESPIIVRSNIGENMTNNNYNDYFNKTKYKKMYYHLAKPVFKKHENSNNPIL